MTNITSVVADSGSLIIHNVKPRASGWICTLEIPGTVAWWHIRREGWAPPCDHLGDAFKDKDTPVVIVAPSTKDAEDLTRLITKLREGKWAQ